MNEFERRPLIDQPAKTYEGVRNKLRESVYNNEISIQNCRSFIPVQELLINIIMIITDMAMKNETHL